MKVLRIKKNGVRLNPFEVTEVMQQLLRRVERSRFSIVVDNARSGFNIKSMRLQQRKAYCGSHPNACQLGGGDRSPKSTRPEGADWVEFNDLINNFFDKKHLTAYIASVACVIRRNALRRTHYGSYPLGGGRNYEWNHDENDWAYTDNLGGRVMVSTFPKGTPGIYRKIGYHEVG